MRANVVLFWILAAFFAFSAGLYAFWSWLVYAESEPVGTVALTLTTILAAFIAFYLGRVHKAQGAELPEDRLDANIDDGDAELGFFSPWSWWPIAVGLSAAGGFLGLAIGFWLLYLSAGFALIALIGWVFEYSRGDHAH